MSNPVWLNWPAPKTVKACYTTRQQGASPSPFDSFNLGLHVGDNPGHVEQNRRHLKALIEQRDIVWLQQVHGIEVLAIDNNVSMSSVPYQADASYTLQTDKVCSVMTADCLPVFFCDNSGTQVAVAHAGWRGLLAGVLQKTLLTFNDPNKVMVYLGPAISQQAFEVGEEVKAAFVRVDLSHDHHFINSDNSGKWMADIYGIARDILTNAGVSAIYGGDRCTYRETQDFFSYRRDGKTGRMANLIWLEKG